MQGQIVTQGMLNQLHSVIQHFFQQNDLGFCEQVDSEDTNTPSLYFAFSYLSEHPVFEINNGSAVDPILNVEIRFNTQENTVEAVEFTCVYIEDPESLNSSIFSKIYTIENSYESFIDNGAEILQSVYEAFEYRNQKFYELIV